MKVTFEIDETLLPDATENELLEWLDFELNASGNMNWGNPLSRFHISAKPNSVEFDDI